MNDLVVLPTWQKEEYVSSQKPYEWLYQFKDNKFLLAQYREKVKMQAGAVGVKNFVALWNAYLQMVTSAQGLQLDGATEFENQPLELYCGEYQADENGITLIDRYGFEIVVCNHPIMPIQRLTNIDTGEVKIEIAYKMGKAWRTMIIDKGTLASSQKILELARYGIAVDSESAKYLVKYFTEIEHLNYDKIPEISSVGRLGWIEEHGFSPYVGNLKFDGEISFKKMFESVQQKGSYEKWLEIVKKTRQKSVIARIMLASSFASVLVEPFDALPFFVHLWGGTEAGKTVGLMLSASVWANPAMGEYIHTFNATSVGQELSAGFVNSLPLLLDELQIIKEKKDFDNIIYMLSEGIGRSRGAKQGGLQRTNTWRNCIITTGEMPISNSTSGGGAVNRIVEIDCKDEKIFDEPVEVVSGLKCNYGFAGKMFIEKFEDNLDYAKQIQKEFYKTLSSGESTEKQAMAGSIILTADKLIEEWLFDDGQVLTIDDIKQFLATKQQVSANERALEWIYDFVSVNANKFIQVESLEHQGQIWGAIDDDYIYFNKSVLDSRMKDNGFNATAFLSWAKRCGHIECSEKRATKQKRIKGFSQPVWCVWLKIQKEESELPFFE